MRKINIRLTCKLFSIFLKYILIFLKKNRNLNKSDLMLEIGGSKGDDTELIKCQLSFNFMASLLNFLIKG